MSKKLQSKTPSKLPETRVKPEIKLEAKTENQQEYLNSIHKNKVTFCDGPAGTGKTYLPTLIGIHGLLTHKYDKLVISRPLVQSDLPTGHLPGTIEEKLAPYIRPIIDTLERSIDKKEIERLIAERKIDVVPFGYMRGLTFHRSFVILDECQNCTFDQLVLGLTRLGPYSKMVISGDSRQSDLYEEKQGGLSAVMQYLQNIDEVGIIHLENKDIIREPIIQKILERLDEEKARQESVAT